MERAQWDADAARDVREEYGDDLNQVERNRWDEVLFST